MNLSKRACIMIVYDSFGIAIDLMEHVAKLDKGVKIILVEENCLEMIQRYEQAFDWLSKEKQNAVLEGKSPFEFKSLLQDGKLELLESLNDIKLQGIQPFTCIIFTPIHMIERASTMIISRLQSILSYPNRFIISVVDNEKTKMIEQKFVKCKIEKYEIDLGLNLEEFSELVNLSDAKHIFIPLDIKPQVENMISEENKWKLEYFVDNEDLNVSDLEIEDRSTGIIEVSDSHAHNDSSTTFFATVSRAYGHIDPLIEYEIHNVEEDPKLPVIFIEYPYQRFIAELKNVMLNICKLSLSFYIFILERV
jgi:hypothetical protein